jgi:hypothetical protein
LSLNAKPKLFSLGQASWQAEHGSPYLRAKAGTAKAGLHTETPKPAQSKSGVTVVNIDVFTK